MRIAVLISGEYRTFAETVQSMPFLSDPFVDIYFSTWNVSTFRFDFLNILKSQTITHQDISKYLGGKGVRTDIADLPDLPELPSSIDRMINRWIAGLDMINKSGITYDYIYIIRPDTYFQTVFTDIVKEIESKIIKDTFYVALSQHLHMKSLGDTVMLSSPYIMNLLINSNLKFQWENTKNIREWHNWWYNYVYDRTRKIEELRMGKQQCLLGCVDILRMPLLPPAKQSGLIDLQSLTDRSIQWCNINTMNIMLKNSMRDVLFHGGDHVKMAFNWYFDRYQIIKNHFLKNSKLISHRGNLRFAIPSEENKPEYILEALDRFDVEIDVWYVNNQFYLGHDNPQYPIDESFLHNDKLWCHAKNHEALEAMERINVVNYFWHEEEPYALTSSGYLWTYPGKPLSKLSIAVMPADIFHITSPVYGICCDYVEFLQVK